MSKFNFDATQVEPAQALSPLPPGWYPVTITESEIKPTKDGTGTRLALTLQVAQNHGASGRKFFEGLNLKNKNAVAQQIAQEQLSAICHAIGTVHLTDTNQLHGKPFLVKVSVSPQRTDPQTGTVYEPRNEVKGFAKLGTEAVVDYDGKAGGAASTGDAPAWAGGEVYGEEEAEEEAAPPAKKKAPPKKQAKAKPDHAKQRRMLTKLGEAADEGDSDAAATIEKLAGENDVDVNAFELWSEVAAALPDVPGGPSGGQAAEEEAEEDVPPWARG